MQTLVYLPLEPYEERYTGQLSSRDGWFMHAAKENNVAVNYVDGTWPGIDEDQDHRVVNTGKVLDAAGRGEWATIQVAKLMRMIESLPSGTVIFFEDMWHPGIEAIPYYAHLAQKEFKVYTQCWAQSVDEYDFTREMAVWMRHHERSLGMWLTGIFVASSCLKDLLVEQNVGTKRRDDIIHVTGLPFSSKMVVDDAARAGITRFVPPCERTPSVVFTSRWDDEKQPLVFCKVAKLVAEQLPDVKFTATTSRPEHSEGWERMRRQCAGTPVQPYRVNKNDYYRHLSQTMIQFNCALQDFVSFTLLEAVTMGCVPVYPNFRSFPEAFEQGSQQEYTSDPGLYLWGLYEHSFGIKKLAKNAADLIIDVIKKSTTSVEEVRKGFSIPRPFYGIAQYHDQTHKRMFDIMFSK